MSDISQKRTPARIASDRRVALAIERAANIFAEKSLRFTKLRQQVFGEIASTQNAVGAYDVLQRLSDKGTRLAPISIYRAIDALIEAGVVHRLESRNAYFACRTVHGAGKRQLIQACEQCGIVTEVDGEIIFETIDDVSAKSGFKPRVKFVEVSGLCPKCAEAPRPEAS